MPIYPTFYTYGFSILIHVTFTYVHTFICRHIHTYYACVSMHTM